MCKKRIGIEFGGVRRYFNKGFPYFLAAVGLTAARWCTLTPTGRTARGSSSLLQGLDMTGLHMNDSPVRPVGTAGCERSHGRYLAEWYEPEIAACITNVAARLDECALVMCAEGLPVTRMMTVIVPADDVAFALFAAPSQAAVVELCRRAQTAPSRLSAAVEA